MPPATRAPGAVPTAAPPPAPALPSFPPAIRDAGFNADEMTQVTLGRDGIAGALRNLGLPDDATFVRFVQKLNNAADRKFAAMPKAKVWLPTKAARDNSPAAFDTRVRNYVQALPPRPPNDTFEPAPANAAQPNKAKATATPSLSSPNITEPTVTPNDVLEVAKNITSGHVRLKVPIRANKNIDSGGWVKTFADTYLQVDVVIKKDPKTGRGIVDYQHTRLDFRNAKDDSPAALDGPLWVNPTAIYVDGSGQIRADLPCMPDLVNLTKDVLGDGVKAVPPDLGSLLSMLQKRCQEPSKPDAPSPLDAFRFDQADLETIDDKGKKGGEVEVGAGTYTIAGFRAAGMSAKVVFSGGPLDFKQHYSVTANRLQIPGVNSSVDSGVGSSRVDLQACKLEYSIVSPK